MELIGFIHWMQQHMILLMMAIFVVIATAVYWPGRRARIERNGLIPFLEDR
ncbi:MAG TPA: hypothetical protein VGC92_16220 [Phenylobacterium sp.]